MRGQISLLISSLALAATTAIPAVAQDETYSPPRFRSGEAPEQPPMAAIGGIVVLQAELAPSGRVTDVLVQADAPPFSEALEEVVWQWRFEPALEDGKAVAADVLVVGVFRAPVLTGGAPPPLEAGAPESDEVPYPLETATPDFPPKALYEDVVLVELEVDANGAVRDALLLRSSEAFDERALEAARRFVFRPARRDGQPAPAFVVVAFGFRQPVTSRRPRVPGSLDGQHRNR